MRAVEIALIGAAAGGVALLIYRSQAQPAGQGGGFDIGSIGQSLSDIGSSVGNAAATVKNTILEAIGMRGIRNNNPGNIRHSATHWQGQSPQQTDTQFVQFDTPEMGIRALSVLLNTYSKKYGLNTVRGIISKYAPASENNTSAYANAVSAALGVLPDDVLNVQARKSELVQAIIKHENGIQPYALATIQTGVSLA